MSEIPSLFVIHQVRWRLTCLLEAKRARFNGQTAVVIEGRYPVAVMRPTIPHPHKTHTVIPHPVTIAMPAPTRLLANVAWRLLEAVVLPLALFYLLLVTAGLSFALIGALTWAYLTVAVKLVRGGSGPSMLLLATAGMATVQAGLTFASGSATVYFLQPTAATYLFAAALLVTVPLERPLIQRMAHDFCPLPPEVLRSAPLRRFFQRVSLLWAAVLFVNASLTLALLLTAPVSWSVPAANAASLPTFLAGLCMSYAWFRSSLRDGGFHLRWGTLAEPGDMTARPTVRQF